ncbi:MULTISPECIES: hypothetical protein [Thiorhodovibrio]|uniref:hypothetical protein n=1 Tax=Thiorhodovibrio TaxID=61593 RepID=UPI001F5D9BF0|nr:MULTISPECIES: hypothetical protein [Thiorhodovibrio]WPL14314.1 hypothetical protein Thiosp_04153 [Thiorhodovibrio litoralis]
MKQTNICSRLAATLSLLLALGLGQIATAQAGSLGDFFKKFGAFDFGGNDFDTAEMQGNRKDWKDRERWVEEALSGAYQMLARADAEVDLFDFQNYFNVLDVQWTPEYLTDPANIGNLNAYATFTEYLSRYLRVKQQLIESIADLNRNLAILNRVDPRELTGPFQLDATGQTKTYTERAAGAVDSTAHDLALANSAGAVEKFTAELGRAIDYGLELEGYFREAASMEAKPAAD